ncbi:hypothetical protein BGX21_004663 [Mortierella sp. AD011]|nr:hypothetical protein BGX21_004663 [Mortierella sp. AD011]
MHERSHFMTLREIDLDMGRNVMSEMVNEFLVSCPALEVLSAEALYVADMAQDGSQPWACLNLRMLRVNIELFDPYQEHIENADNDLEGEGSENDKEARESMEALQLAGRQRLIIAQLAKLKKLKVLYANRNRMGFWRSGPKECVEFTLEKGLDQLAGLTQLEQIYLGRWDQPRLIEAEWMLNHWRQLKVVQRDLYRVCFDKSGHDLSAMFAAPEGLHDNQKEFDVLQ